MPSPTPEQIAAMRTHPVRLYLNAHRLTQAQLAARADVNIARLNEVLRGRKTFFSEANAEKLEKVSAGELKFDELRQPWPPKDAEPKVPLCACGHPEHPTKPCSECPCKKSMSPALVMQRALARAALDEAKREGQRVYEAKRAGSAPRKLRRESSKSRAKR